MFHVESETLLPLGTELRLTPPCLPSRSLSSVFPPVPSVICSHLSFVHVLFAVIEHSEHPQPHSPPRSHLPSPHHPHLVVVLGSPAPRVISQTCLSFVSMHQCLV